AAGGVIDVQSGTILLNGNGISAGGTFLVAGNARLDFNGSQTLTGTYTGSGYGTVAISGGTYTGDETTQFSFPSPLFEWTGGTLTGTFTNTGLMTIAGTGIRFLSGTLNNSGIILHKDTGVLAFISGILNNESSGEYDFTGDGAFRWWSGSQGLINNDGLLRKSGGLGESNFSGQGSLTMLNNTGTVEVSSGTLNVNGPDTQIDSGTLTAGTWIANDGTLSLNANITTNDASLILAGSSGNIPAISNLTTNHGSFTIENGAAFTASAAFTNQGILTLGAGGAMNVSGDFSQGTGAMLKFAIGGPSTGGNFGTLTVSGNASLAGGLELKLADGYGPQTGNSYTVATYSSRSGAFGEETGLTPFFTSDLSPAALVINAIGTASDLSVSTVSSPGALSLGESATLTYTVTNLSGRAATAPWKDSVYVSTDTTWDDSDILVGSSMVPDDLAVGASYNGSVDLVIPSIPNNRYFLLVVADSDGMVPDIDRMNNYATTASTIEIVATRLRVI
ncbi:MAG: hypothetical protein KJT03_21770, partial [Verrucomicrobiae bacterium]|nr:hypothetical protein [Verrucomicrobiae bacterium]